MTNTEPSRPRLRLLCTAILAAVLPCAIVCALLDVWAAQGAAVQPPQPAPQPGRPSVLWVGVNGDPDDEHPENQLVDAQLTIGLLSDKPEQDALNAYCPETDEVVAAQGEVLAYCYRLENKSVFTYTRHTVADSVLGTIAEDEVFTLTPTMIVQAVLTGPATATQTSFISWTAYTEDGDAVTDFSNATVIVPALVTTTTVDAAPDGCGAATQIALPAPGAVTFCIRAYNTNPFTLTEHVLTDSLGGRLLLPEALELGPGESYTVTATAFVTEPLTYETTWTARTALRQIPVTSTTYATVRPPYIDAALAFGRAGAEVCTSSVLTVTAGSEVLYCYSATNSGGILLDKHLVSDDSYAFDHEFDYQLPPNNAVGIVVTRVITESTTSRVTWYARLGGGSIVTDTTTGTVVVVPPAAVQVSARLVSEPAQTRPIPNIRIRLVDAEGGEQFQSTNLLGIAEFGDLLPGMYQVSVVTASLKSVLQVVSITPIAVEVAPGATVTASFALTGEVPGQDILLPLIQR